MKTLFLILFTIFSLKLSSQVITLTFDESETLFKEGNYVDLNIVQLLESDPLYFCYGGINTKKVFDLNKKVVLFYVNNEVNDTINIKNFDLKNGIYTIVLDDINFFTKNQLNTYQIIDTNKNKSYYCWYYFESDESWAISEKIINLNIK
jgi:hypothetical protein